MVLKKTPEGGITQSHSKPVNRHNQHDWKQDWAQTRRGRGDARGRMEHSRFWDELRNPRPSHDPIKLDDGGVGSEFGLRVCYRPSQSRSDC